MRVGKNEEEIYLSKNRLKFAATAHDTLQPVRNLCGKKPLRNDEDVIKLIGKSVFVSRLIRGYHISGSGKVAYRMHRLWGRLEKDAPMIREAMIDAKIEMLQRLMEHPESPFHLSCRKGFFDYETRIRRAIEIISHYSEYPVPED